MRKGEVRKQKIIDTAEKLFYQKGYDETSVDDILSVINGSKGCFYYHFESKMSVLIEICCQHAANALRRYHEAVKPDMTVMDKINLLLYYAIPIRTDTKAFIGVLFAIVKSNAENTIFRQYCDSLVDAFAPELSIVLSQGNDEDLLYVEKSAGVASLVLLLLNTYWSEVIKTVSGSIAANGSIDMNDLIALTDLYRFAFERLIQAPYGSIELVRVNDLYQLLSGILVK